MTIQPPDVEALIRDFAARIAAAAEAQADERVRAALAAAFPELAQAAPAGPPKPAKATVVRGRRKLKLSAKTLAVRKLQGRYLGALRGLPPTARARVKKVAREKGVAAAVEFAGSLK
jgi:hypothetical protein